MFLRFTIIVFFLIVFNPLIAHYKDSSVYYFVYLKNKKSSFNISRPEEFLSYKAIKRREKFSIQIDSTDLPVNLEYIESIKRISGIKIIGISKWLNGLEVSIDKFEGFSNQQINSILNKISELPDVKGIKYLGILEKNNIKNDRIEVDKYFYTESQKLISIKKDSNVCAFSEKDYGKSFDHNKAIGLPTISALSGKMSGFHIAVFDAGFHNAYKIKGMEDLLDSGLIVRDFVDHDNSVWEDDQHGCNVLGFLKTYNPGNYIGSAPFANYTLIRTENANLESLTEEVNWLLAAEFVDSLGVDLISGSVGYHSFDENILNHSYQETTGDSSIISKAANKAYQKGIMVVVSAGNEGNYAWRHIGFPADAQNVLSIGACDGEGNYAKFSSMGPTIDGRIKPNFLVAGYKVNVASANGFYAGNGTSYSTPIFSGAVAQLMFLHPNLSLDSIKKALVSSSTHRHIPDSLYGYGIPDFALATRFLSGFKTINEDLFWINKNATFLQDLNIYFVSSHIQNVKLYIYTSIKGKRKTVYKKIYTLQKGEVLESDLMLQFFLSKKQLRRKKWQLSNFELVFVTANGTFQKTFQIR
jgi:hypothetical protein